AGPININALEVRFGADAFPPIVPPVVPVSVYITVGNTWNGNQTNAAAWTPVALNIPVMKGGINADFSYFDLPAPGITLAPGETRGIYVIGTTHSLVYSAGAGSTNGVLTLCAGAATGALFGGTFISAREPNISIHSRYLVSRGFTTNHHSI